MLPFSLRLVLGFFGLQLLFTSVAAKLLARPGTWLATRLFPTREQPAPQQSCRGSAKRAASNAAAKPTGSKRIAEGCTNDQSIPWPRNITSLPTEWPRPKAKGQPYFLNHQRGATRVQETAQRIAAAIGSTAAIAMLNVIEGRSFGSLGLHTSAGFIVDLALGGATGFALVALMFVIEWKAGWLALVGTFETFAPGESFSSCFLVDVVFHAAVSVNEEIPLRGWLLLNAAEACAQQWLYSPKASLAIATVGESCIFALMHIGSPCASRTALLNLVVGGVAAALNLLISGSLAFPLGWHFAWNISMGNVFGLSTSGIPISATVLSVVPHPSKARWHGGTFGPEQSVLAIPAYVLGVLVLFACYGLRRWEAGVAVSEGFPALSHAEPNALDGVGVESTPFLPHQS